MRLLVVALALLLVPFWAGSSAAKPNIVVIMTDDQRDIDPLERMPNTTALLTQQGIRFVNSFVVNPVCCAARASFLSGQYSHNDGVWDNQGGERPGGFKAFKGDDNTIACWLQQSGYRTALIGKYLNGYGAVAKHYRPPCWNEWWGLVRPFRYYDYEANHNGVMEKFGKGRRDYQEDVVSGLTQKFIAGGDQPFFIWITGIAPHGGYPNVNTPDPPKRYKSAFKTLELPQPPNFNESDVSDKPKFMRNHLPVMDHSAVKLSTQSYRLRAETLLAADDMVGAIVNELKTKGLLENTYVIFTSDNGFFQGEHRMPIGKHLLYEEALRVPLVIRGPQIAANETRTQMVLNLDVTATIVDLAGATAGRTLDGRSLVPLFSAPDTPWRTGMLVEGVDVVPANGEGGTIFGFYSGVRTPAYIYGEHVNRKETYDGNEFYDLGADPYEVLSRPKDPQYKAVIDQLKPLLANLRTCQGEACWVSDVLARVPPRPPVKPEIGAICKSCKPLDPTRALEPAESDLTR